MQRRTFLVLCVGGVGAACVPPAGSRKVAGEPDDDAGVTAPDAQATMKADATSPAAQADANEADAGADASGDPAAADAEPAADADVELADAAEPADAGTCQTFVQMHDTHAQALYFDGTYGPLTGVCTVDYVLANAEVDLEFWHGHNGMQHHFLLKPEHFAALKRGERVMIETTEVDSHQHLLFIDPMDESYRVDGAPDVAVPSC